MIASTIGTSLSAKILAMVFSSGSIFAVACLSMKSVRLSIVIPFSGVDSCQHFREKIYCTFSCDL